MPTIVVCTDEGKPIANIKLTSYKDLGGKPWGAPLLTKWGDDLLKELVDGLQAAYEEEAYR